MKHVILCLLMVLIKLLDVAGYLSLFFFIAYVITVFREPTGTGWYGLILSFFGAVLMAFLSGFFLACRDDLERDS